MAPPVHIGKVTIGAKPRVVGVLSLPLTMDRLASGWRPVCDILELRVDLLGAGLPDWLERATELEAEGRPVLVTLRHAREGGHWFGTDEDRLNVLTRILPHVSAVDYEVRSAGFSTLVQRAHAAGKPVVASYHDFHGCPTEAELRAVVTEATAADADIIKIAAVTQHEEELARLESFLAAHQGAPLCLLGMGALGPESRKRLPAHGSCLTYGYVDEANVPGQLSSAELMDYVRQLPG